jgi:ribosomal protein S18 acetylase RimI-like enzyme
MKRFSLGEHVTTYSRTGYHADETGYIVWRVGTGRNVELLHLRAYTPRRGHGTQLLKRMLHSLTMDPPYSSVFGFCLGSNLPAWEFYRKMGFILTRVAGVYAEGSAYVFSQRYDILKEKHGVTRGDS